MEYKLRNALIIVLCILLPVNMYLIMSVPEEITMGVVQKIFYFHVASAWVGLLAFVVVFMASIWYLVGRQERVNLIARASAEIGMLFISCTLLTGPLWAKPIWNTWWTWDPRLTTTVVLWFMYLAYIILQGEGTSESRRRFSAVYGIIAFVNVPLVFFSARWWRSIHPVVVSSEGTGLSPEMVRVLLISVLTFSVLYFYFLVLRYVGLELTDRVNKLKVQLF